jgi:hypothetical protein
MEVLHEMKVYQVHYTCDKCHEGNAIFTGMVYYCQPPAYQHKCDKCGDITSMDKSYPTMRYKDVNWLE